MIEIAGLSARFGPFHLKDISLSITGGECFVLLGPSGAGKTLLLETILGIKRPEQGSVRVDGREILDEPPERRGMGYVPQDLALFPHLSVRENILFGPQVRRLPTGQAEQDLARWAELLNLEALLDRRDVVHLSGGEKQRVALARALIVQPTILLLDEPFASLDQAIRRELQLQFRTLQKSLGVTFLQVTHDHEEAFLMADHIGVMMNGRLEQVTTAEEAYRRPVNLQVARFLMMHNLWPARVEEMDGDRATCQLGGLRIEIERGDTALEVGQSVWLGIWPEEIWMARPDRPVSEERRVNLFSGVVEDVLNLGTRQWVRVRTPDEQGIPLEVALSHLALRTIQPRPGSRVNIQLRPDAICVFPEGQTD